MANENRNTNDRRSPADSAREKLAADWGQMAASMVSPGGANGGGASGRGGAAPLPVSALPLPNDEPEPQQEPAPSLPTNKEGKLTPAQRARLGLDIYGDDEPGPPAQPQAGPAAPTPAGTPPRAESPDLSERQVAPPSEFGFNEIDPYAHPPAPAASPNGARPQQPQGNAAASAQPQQQSGIAPASSEPKLAPVGSEPKLAPVSKPVAPRRPAQPRPTAAAPKKGAAPRERQRDDTTYEDIKHDRSVLSFGIAWTAFAVVVTGAIAFTTTMNGDPAASTGPGPLVPGLLSIALGWVVVAIARPMGKGWMWLMVIPVTMLFVGPYFYRSYWSTSVDDAAHSYLSPTGQHALVDVDSTSVVSETVNTDRGCFGIVRKRSNHDTVVSVVTYQPATARQQADYALAPRYAGRVAPGGDAATSRVFTFRGGRAPAQVQVPRDPPLDCANSTSAPGTGADPYAQEQQNSQ